MSDDRYLQFVQSIIPYVIMGSIDIWKIVIGLLLLLVPWVWSSVQTYFIEQSCSITVSSRDVTRWWSGNKTYEYIDIYITHNYPLDEVFTDEFRVTRKIPNTHVEAGTAVKKPAFSTMKLMFKGVQITIRKSNESGGADNKQLIAQFKLSASTMKVLTDFIEEATGFAIDFRIKTEVNMYKIYFFSKGDKSWTGQDINVCKNSQNVFLPPDTKSVLVKSLNEFKSENFKKINANLGLPNKYSYLFHGKPGCGKTSAVLFIANYLNIPIYSCPCTDLTIEEMRCALALLPEHVIVLLDDVDCNPEYHARKTVETTFPINTSDTATATATPPVQNVDAIMSMYTVESNRGKLKLMLEFLDAYSSLNNSIIVMCANHPEKLDPAFIRPGRIDYKLEFVEQRDKDILELFPDAEIKSNVVDTLIAYRRKLLERDCAVL